MIPTSVVKPTSSFALVAIAMGLCGCSSAAKREIRAELEQYYADLSARDWDAFESHFWPGAILTSVWAPPGEDEQRVVSQTIRGFIAAAPEGPGSKPIFEERMTSAFIIVERDLAQAWAAYEARFGEPGDVTEWEGIDAITLLQHDGEWRIVSIAYQAK